MDTNTPAVKKMLASVRRSAARVRITNADLVQTDEQVRRYMATRKPGDNVTVWPRSSTKASHREALYYVDVFRAADMTVTELSPEQMEDYR